VYAASVVEDAGNPPEQSGPQPPDMESARPNLDSGAVDWLLREYKRIDDKFKAPKDSPE
jgi:hypothetical protein